MSEVSKKSPCFDGVKPAVTLKEKNNQTATTFTSSPLELRNLILSERLSVKKNVSVKELEGQVAEFGFQLPDIEILTINRQILEEAGRCIGRENILFSFACYYEGNKFLHFASSIIPLWFIGLPWWLENESKLPPRLFDISITHSILNGSEIEDDHAMALIHLQHLPTSVQLINCYQSSFRFNPEPNKTWEVPLGYLTISPTEQGFLSEESKRSVVDLAFESLKGLRNVRNVSELPHKSGLEFTHTRLFLQEWDLAARKKIRSAIQPPSIQPAWDVEEIIEEIHRLKSQAVALSEKGLLFEARTQYMLVRLLIGDGVQFSDWTKLALSPHADYYKLPSGMYLVYLDLSLALERVSARLGFEMESQAIQEVTEDFIRRKVVNRNRNHNPSNDEHISMFLHYVDEMNEYGDFTRAAGMLHFARRRFPDNINLQEKQQELPQIRADFCRAHNITMKEFRMMDKATRNNLISQKLTRRGSAQVISDDAEDPEKPILFTDELERIW